jgi:hypothetical protein
MSPLGSEQPQTVTLPYIKNNVSRQYKITGNITGSSSTFRRVAKLGTPKFRRGYPSVRSAVRNNARIVRRIISESY